MPIDDPIYTSTVLLYGADTNYDVEGDAFDSSPLVVEPSTGQIRQGLFRPGQQFAAQHVNWALQQAFLILTGLISNDGLHETELASHAAELADHETRISTVEDYDTNLSPRIKIYPYLTSGTFQPSARVIAGLMMGYGGGASGGSGAVGGVTVDKWMAGAGGGGGSILQVAPLPILDPSKIYNIDVGAGGSSVAVAASGGNDGGDTIFRYSTTPIITCPGAQAGRGVPGTQNDAGATHYTFGGMSRRGTQILLIGPPGRGIRYSNITGTVFDVVFGQSLYIPMQPAQGGWGAGGDLAPLAGPGSPNPFGNFAGGLAGVRAADDGTKRGGGGGGGGGAGPFGKGGDGGNGQLPSGALTGDVHGGQGGNNTGAGGGGGGSEAYSNGLGPGFGGGGGSGGAFIITVEEST